MSAPAHSFVHERTVEFSETDMAGIVHFSNYFRWMESAEHAFFRSLGMTLHWHEGERMHGWARVRAECRYRAPTRYAERVRVELTVLKKTGTRLAYGARILRLDEEGEPTLAAEGELEVVHVVREPGTQRIQAAPMPEQVDAAIALAPPTTNPAPHPDSA